MVGPSVLGTAAAGKQLTGLSGTWGGFDAITYHFQWFRCNAAGAGCLSVHGATSPTYSLGNRDIGKTLGLTVYATDSTGTASAFSSLIGPIAPSRPLLESTAQPLVTGPPVVGKVIQVTTGNWSPTPPTLAYRWERCNANARACAAIASRHTSSYTVANADLGHSLLAIVQATNGSTTQNAFSTATPAVVAHEGHGPLATVSPTVNGAAIIGQQISAQAGIWQGVGSIAFAFQWFRCDPAGAALQGDSRRHSERLHAGRQGHRQDDRPRADRGRLDRQGNRVREPDRPGGAAGAALTPITLPTISGTARVGGELDVDTGQWSSKPRSYAYSWLRCNMNGRLCTAIASATGHRTSRPPPTPGTRSSSRSPRSGRSDDAVGAHCRNRPIVK